MKKFALLYSLILSALGVLGQNIDSLERKLQERLPDSIRIKTMILLADEYQFVNVQKSISLGEQAVKIAEAKKLDQLRVDSYVALASFYSIRGDNSTSSTFNTLALNISIQRHDSLTMAMSYNNLGTDYLALGKFDEAYFYFTQSYRVANASKDSLRMTVSLHNIATVFKELGQYERAVNYLMLSKKLSTIINDVEGDRKSVV